MGGGDEVTKRGWEVRCDKGAKRRWSDGVEGAMAGEQGRVLLR